jgi:integrase
MFIVKDVPGFAVTLKTTAKRLYFPAMLALFTGMRRGEILALRRGRVDLDRKTISVQELLEQTERHALQFKQPKSKAGRWEITLPDILVDVLRDCRKAQLELRMKLGGAQAAG